MLVGAVAVGTIVALGTIVAVVYSCYALLRAFPANAAVFLVRR